jgi:Cft2 family RNA processing exonuclease
MEVRILGAHNLETRSTRLSGVLVDSVLQLDAGSLTSSLTLEEQANIKAIFITHRHFDHVRDLLTFAINTGYEGTTPVFALPEVLEDISTHLVNGALYPKFTERPSPQAPKLRFVPIQAGETVKVNGYSVKAVPVPHGVPAAGFEITSAQGRRLFYTGDTSGPLAHCWENTEPDLLITEVTYPNQRHDYALQHGHMAPMHLQHELAHYYKHIGRSLRVVAVHMYPPQEAEVALEVRQVARELKTDIQLAYEDMRLTL